MNAAPRPAGSAAPPTRVAIIGSGFSGIAAAVALKRHGISDFTIFELSAGIGGTWWNNRYPGAEVDLESHIYSFSFARSDWTRTHARWDELQRYLESVVDRFGLRPHLVLNEKVESVTWAEERGEYDIVTSSGASHGAFQAVISAVGFLNVPLIPPFARGDTGFGGVICHTSAWPAGLDLAGKKVAVLGTGSSAVQVVAEAATCAAELRIFQIEPNWLLPKGNRDFTARGAQAGPQPARVRVAPPPALPAVRPAADPGQPRPQRRPGQPAAPARRPGVPQLRPGQPARPAGAATPDFPVEARRTVISDTYYAALLQPNVQLVPHAVKGLTSSGAIDANGDQHDVDVIVLATGFDAANYLGNYRVFGVNGVELHEQWAGEPQAFLGLMVPGFPNFFMMYGPNTNSAPLVSFYEAQARFAARTIRHLRTHHRRAAEVPPLASARYNDWLQSRLAQTVFASTTSYFQAGTGRVVSQWPFSASFYITATRVLRRIVLRYR